jgi:hypothetical protein
MAVTKETMIDELVNYIRKNGYTGDLNIKPDTHSISIDVDYKIIKNGNDGEIYMMDAGHDKDGIRMPPYLRYNPNFASLVTHYYESGSVKDFIEKFIKEITDARTFQSFNSGITAEIMKQFFEKYLDDKGYTQYFPSRLKTIGSIYNIQVLHRSPYAVDSLRCFYAVHDIVTNLPETTGMSSPVTLQCGGSKRSRGGWDLHPDAHKSAKR